MRRHSANHPARHPAHTRRASALPAGPARPASEPHPAPAAPASTVAPASGIIRVGFAPITRIDHGNREIELCATSEAVDTYGTVFAYEASRDAFDRWAGNVREMHERKAVGRRVAVRCDDAARRIFVRVRISRGAADTWEKICDGTLRGASIGASNVEWVTEQRMGRELPVAHRYDLVELSLVDLPSNPDALGVTFVRDGVPLSDLLDELPDPPPEIPPTIPTLPPSPYSQLEMWGSILDDSPATSDEPVPPATMPSPAPEQLRATEAPAALDPHANDTAPASTPSTLGTPREASPAREDGAATAIAPVNSHAPRAATRQDGADGVNAVDAVDAATREDGVNFAVSEEAARSDAFSATSKDAAASDTTSVSVRDDAAPDQPPVQLSSPSVSVSASAPSLPPAPTPAPTPAPVPAPNMAPLDPAAAIAAAALDRGRAALSSAPLPASSHAQPASASASASGPSPRGRGEAGSEVPSRGRGEVGSEVPPFHTTARDMLRGCGCAACQRALVALTDTLAVDPEAARGSSTWEPAPPTPIAYTAHEQRTQLALDAIERRLAVLEAQPMPGGPQLRFADKTHPLQPAASFGGQPNTSDQFRALAALAGKLTDHQAQLAVATELIRLQQEAAGLSPHLQAMPRAGSGAVPGTRSSRSR